MNQQFFVRSAIALATLAATTAFAAPQAQPNLGLGLRELVAFQAQSRTDLAQPSARAALAQRFEQGKLVQVDEAGRVLVDVHLDGRRPLSDVRDVAARLGGKVLVVDSKYRHGLISLWVPVHKAVELAQAPGVRSVLLAPPPVTHIGKATSQGVGILHSDIANAQGFTGSGITVGALSDSYDKGSSGKGAAATDVTTGDLPGAGNPDGYTTPVVVFKDSTSGADEGRAMLQIIHDVAPAAHLCFATANSTPAAFAANIRALADPNGTCKADVVVDDVSYFAEPMFQDGIIAQAVDDVNAEGVAYFSAAGNEPANNGFAATFAPIADADARALQTTVNLALIAAGTTPGGFHDFGAGTGTVDLAKTVIVPTGGSGRVDFQWNDPWDAGNVKTDYDLYVFSADGKTIVARSTDNNEGTDEPIELNVNLSAGTYQVVIARADTNGISPSAPQLRWTIFGDVAGGDFLTFNSPTTFGHSAAAGSISTAAHPYFQAYVPEPFTSLGPVTMYYDKDGNKLAQAETRQKPDVAAPDGGNTTFFVSDDTEDADTLPNFYGTSAAAPHAAAVAALMLQKAGGPRSMAPADVRSVLQNSAPAHDLQPSTAVATISHQGGSITLTASGDGNNYSGANAGTFALAMKAPAGWSLQSITIDVAGSDAQRVHLGVASPGLQFDPRATGGFPFTLGTLKGITAADITASTLSQSAPFSQQLMVSFAPGSFTGKSTLQFGVDRDEVALGAGGNSADLLDGGTLTGVVVDPKGKTHAFTTPITTGKVGKGWNAVSGYGLVDATAALAQIN